MFRSGGRVQQIGPSFKPRQMRFFEILFENSTSLLCIPRLFSQLAGRFISETDGSKPDDVPALHDVNFKCWAETPSTGKAPSGKRYHPKVVESLGGGGGGGGPS